jgi:hypothetical protein
MKVGKKDPIERKDRGYEGNAGLITDEQRNMARKFTLFF